MASTSPDRPTARMASANAAGVTSAPRSTGLPIPAAVAQHGNGSLEVGGQLRNLKSASLRGIGSQHIQPARVADHADPVAGRQWLAGQQPGGVEQLTQGVGADHARLFEQGSKP